MACSFLSTHSNCRRCILKRVRTNVERFLLIVLSLFPPPIMVPHIIAGEHMLVYLLSLRLVVEDNEHKPLSLFQAHKPTLMLSTVFFCFSLSPSIYISTNCTWFFSNISFCLLSLYIYISADASVSPWFGSSVQTVELKLNLNIYILLRPVC